MTTRKKKRPVRMATKTQIPKPEPKKSPESVAEQEEPKETLEAISETPEPEAKEPEVKEPEANEPPDNVVEITGKSQDKMDQEAQDKYDAMPEDVEDPGNTFKLAMLDSELRAAGLDKEKTLMEIQIQLQNIQIQQRKLAEKQKQVIEHSDHLIKALNAKIKRQQDYIEEKHGIVLKYYTYDDVTGNLKKLPRPKQ